eukprot:6212395-Pleurochrysis_carterae.AAC.4
MMYLLSSLTSCTFWFYLTKNHAVISNMLAPLTSYEYKKLNKMISALVVLAVVRCTGQKSAAPHHH